MPSYPEQNGFVARLQLHSSNAVHVPEDTVRFALLQFVVIVQQRFILLLHSLDSRCDSFDFAAPFRLARLRLPSYGLLLSACQLNPGNRLKFAFCHSPHT